MRCKFCPRSADVVYYETWNVCTFCRDALNAGVKIGEAVGARTVLRKVRPGRAKR